MFVETILAPASVGQISGQVFYVWFSVFNLFATMLFWAVMTDIAEQVVWHGRKLSKEDWKHVLSAALYQQDVVPNIDGNGFVVLGKSTSKMTVREMRDLIELAQAFGTEPGVKFGDESRRGFDWVAAYGRAAA